MTIIQGNKHQRIVVERLAQSVTIALYDRHNRKSLNVFPECLVPLAAELLRLADEFERQRLAQND